MSLKSNVAANYFGQGWQALMNFAFVPIYIKYLRVEAYGLIGIFAFLQAWLVLLDMGLKPALGREMARFTAGAHDVQSIRDLLRSVELIGIAIAIAISLGIWAASGWLATHWVTAKHIPVEVVAHAFALMGLVAALRFLQDIYVSGSIGLQRQVPQNIVISITATLRGLGAVALLAWVSPTIEAFFLWQAALSVLTVALLAAVVYSALPPAPRGARFSGAALLNIRCFAKGILGITFLTLLLNQVDKIVLSHLLTLESFGYYTLAAAVTSALYTLTGPITEALYPRFTELVTKGDEAALRTIYHQGAQMVTVLTGSAALVLMIFGYKVLRLWTGNPELAQKVAPLLAVMSLGMLLNGLTSIPYLLQLAYGWTSLMIKVDVVAVILLVPAILLFVPIYGAISAAWLYVALNASYVMFIIPIMHRRLLPTDKWRWYRQDVVPPLAVATAFTLLCRWVMPHNLGKLGEFIALLTTSMCVLIAASTVAPMVRGQIARYLSFTFMD